MTLEMQTALERELKDAKTPEDRALAQSHILLALRDCQRKTAERVKKLSWKVISIALALGTGGGAALSNIDKVIRIFGGGAQ